MITRHGKPVVELRRAHATHSLPAGAIEDWLTARRDQRKPISITSVELLDQMYDTDD